MITAGFGCMSGCGVEELQAVLRAAEFSCGTAATALAAPSFKRREAGLLALADRLGLPIRWVDDAGMAAVAERVKTHSAVSMRMAGTPSVAEAAALAAAGENAVLLQSRIAHPRATCALAVIAA
ncbi:MAG: cobalamin biosynthesis protein [Acetobacteraceae bacterium]|nr:cobalamin biosynthesis protein [Acetobacteraceae bacterium]